MLYPKFVSLDGKYNSMENIKGGKTLETIDPTLDGIFAVALGAQDGTTLFMFAAPDWDEASREAETKGRMLSTQVKVGHAGTP